MTAASHYAPAPALSLDVLRKSRGERLRTLKLNPARIPEYSGIYIWRYWPTFPDATLGGVLAALERWRSASPGFEEVVRNSRIRVKVLRAPLGVDEPGGETLLGMEAGKSEDLRACLEASEANRKAFLQAAECLIALAPPLYVGKADNLRARLTQHFAEGPVVQELEKAGLSDKDVYVSFVRDPSATDFGLNVILEEVLQRLTNPPLVKRYG